MERAANFDLTMWRDVRDRRGTLFVCSLALCAAASLVLASWVPLQFSIVTVLLFAGPHNFFEFRYFLMKMPVRLGKSRNFFAVAFAGIFLLTVAYLALPLLYHTNIWSGSNWLTLLAGWNSVVLLWLAALIWMRGKQRAHRDWFWAWPLAFAIGAANWMAPELFSLALVYLHPLIAFWFLDRQLRRSHPQWLRIYRRSLAILPLILLGMIWQLSQASSLPADNGLAWRITQHAGAEILPNVPSHLLVSLHVFLEMLHYLIWIIILPVLSSRGKVWSLKSIPLVTHPQGWPRLIAACAGFAAFLVALLWAGFAIDYSVTRDLYFAVAIAHVLAEAPFLLRSI